MNFHTHDGLVAVDMIAKMLLDLPRGREAAAQAGRPDHITFDRRGHYRKTVAWRYADGSWGVTFRDPPTSADKRHVYENPVEGATAILVRKHVPFLKADLARAGLVPEADVTAAVLGSTGTDGR
jgi:hypothetical protein